MLFEQNFHENRQPQGACFFGSVQENRARNFFGMPSPAFRQAGVSLFFFLASPLSAKPPQYGFHLSAENAAKTAAFFADKCFSALSRGTQAPQGSQKNTIPPTRLGTAEKPHGGDRKTAHSPGCREDAQPVHQKAARYTYGPRRRDLMGGQAGRRGTAAYRPDDRPLSGKGGPMSRSMRSYRSCAAPGSH